MTKIVRRKKSATKIAKAHRKERMKIAKNSVDYDWLDMHDYVCKSILHMCEYYEDKENVAQCEEEREKTLNSLLKAKQMIIEFDKYEADYYEKLKDECWVIKNGICISATDESIKETVNEHSKREEEFYKNLYSYIGENLQLWWD